MRRRQSLRQPRDYTGFADDAALNRTAGRYAANAAARAYLAANVQRFVVASGHCTIPPDLVGAAFDDLVRWAERKEKPAAGEQKPPAAGR